MLFPPNYIRIKIGCKYTITKTPFDDAIIDKCRNVYYI